MLEYEYKYNQDGYNKIAGMDEAGRGPLAGAVFCACVIMPLDDIIEGVDDSKKLSSKKREKLFEIIKQKAISYSITNVSEKVIDDINILNATKLGMCNAVKSLSVTPDFVLVDAVKGLDINIPYLPIIHGDALSYNIACASILAKVARDKYIEDLSEKYPEYGFQQHKGYGTQKHILLLKQYGPCALHRKSFIKHFVGGNDDK